MREAGVLPGVWFTQAGNSHLAPEDAGFLVAEVEGNPDYDGLLSTLPYLDPGMPKAVITNLSGLVVKKANGETDIPATRERCAPLIEAGFWCQTEIYLSEAPDISPAHLEYIATQQCGWDSAAPVFGTYGGKTLADYSQWRDIPGWGVYLAEYL